MTTIYCKSQKNVNHFYLCHEGEEYYLFTQSYRRGVTAYFCRGVTCDKALDFGKARHDTAVKNTMEKLPSYLRYIEKEYGIEVLRKTVKKNRRLYKNKINV